MDGAFPLPLPIHREGILSHLLLICSGGFKKTWKAQGSTSNWQAFQVPQTADIAMPNSHAKPLFSACLKHSARGAAAPYRGNKRILNVSCYCKNICALSMRRRVLPVTEGTVLILKSLCGSEIISLSLSSEALKEAVGRPNLWTL